MEKSVEELYNERVTRVKTAISLKEPDRVPVYFPCETWLASYSGYTIQEMIYDYDKIVAATEKTIKDFQWDCIWPPLGVWPAAVFDAVGQTQYLLAGGGIAPESTYQFPDVSPMQPEDYPEFIADPFAFIVEKILPRRCTELAKPFPRNAIALAKGALAFGQYLSCMGAAFQKWAQVYGAPLLMSGISDPALDIIEDHYRGFKGILLDIKRRPEQVKAACEALFPLTVRFAQVSYGGPPADFPLVFLPLHIGMFLRPVDFEEFYWPTFRKLVETLIEMGYGCLLFLEGDWEPYFDFLVQLPKGKIVGLYEHPDIAKAKAALGNTMCLAGGMPCSLLGYGTKEECIAHAKKVIDDCAPGGSFIFASDKALLSPNDAKPENLEAVTKFVKEYGVYKK